MDFVIKQLTNFIDFDDIEKPQKNFIENLDFKIDPNLTLSLKIGLQLHNFESQDSLVQLVSETTNFQFLDWEKTPELQYIDRETFAEPLIKFAIGGTNRRTKHSRQVYDFMAFASDIGGLYGTFFFIGLALNLFFNRKAADLAYIEHLFVINDQVLQKQFSGREDRRAWWNTLQKTKLGFCARLWLTWAGSCCFALRKKRRLDKAQRRVNRFLDVERQIRTQILFLDVIRQLVDPAIVRLINVQRKNRVLDSSRSSSSESFASMTFDGLESELNKISISRQLAFKQPSVDDLIRGVFDLPSQTKERKTVAQLSI